MRRRWYRPRPAPAVANTSAIVLSLLRDWFHMPHAVEEAVLGSIMEARFSRARDLKQHLCVAGSMHIDLDHLFAEVLTPPFWMALLHDLALEGLLSQQARIRAEECVLRQVTAAGTWRNDDGPPRAA